MSTTIFTIGTFNILANGLGNGEFLSEGGDNVSVNWDVRGPKVANVLSEMIKECDVVVTQENDEFFSLLEQMRHNTGLNISGVYCIKNNSQGKLKLTNCRSLRTIHLYNKIFNNSTQHEILEPNPKDENHEIHYIELNKENKLRNTLKTFEQTCGRYGSELATIYDKHADDVFISDCGIGVYYNADKVSLTNSDCQDFICDIPIIYNIDGWVKCVFQKEEKLVTVFGAHLPSGETSADESKRVTVLRKILSQTASEPNTIIAMDSNNSPLYEVNYCLPETLSVLIKQFEFKDAVPSKGYQTFKMRHNMGSQIKKHCMFMFDTIDKILYKSIALNERAYNRYEFGFHKYDITNYDLFQETRSNKDKRSEFETFFRHSPKIDDSLVMFKDYPLFTEIYPNSKAPSDHSPIVAQFTI